MKKLTINFKSQTVKQTKNLAVTQSKRVFVNNDGTIAENHQTYKEFQQDIIKSAGLGW